MYRISLIYVSYERRKRKGGSTEGERVGESAPTSPQGFESENLEDSLSEARLRSGDNAVITSFEYFILSFPHFRFVSSSSTSASLLELASSGEEERHAFAIANVYVTVFATASPLSTSSLRLCTCSRKCSCRLSLCWGNDKFLIKGPTLGACVWHAFDSRLQRKQSHVGYPVN